MITTQNMGNFKNKKNYCTIYLVRHGETEGNVRRIIMGHSDAPLTAAGKEQARAVAKVLEGNPIDAIYASDLGRAVETAQIIADKRQLPINTSLAIREKHYGAHEGRLVNDYLADMRETHDNLSRLSNDERKKFQYPDGVENDMAVADRIAAFLKKIAVMHRGKGVIVVSHGSAIRNFLLAIGFITRENMRRADAIENGDVVTLLCDGEDFQIVETNGVNTT